MSGNTKDKIAVCNNTGKTTPAATAPMANAYANATVLEKIENLAATYCHRKCNETSSRFPFLNIKETINFIKPHKFGSLLNKINVNAYGFYQNTFSENFSEW